MIVSRMTYLVLYVFTCFMCSAALAKSRDLFRQDDIVVLAGGENMLEVQRTGYLETALTIQWPDQNLRFRNIAWEGDTVFEQRRDVNFGTWPQQIKKSKATLLILQFGQAESLAGLPGLENFLAAYAKLIVSSTNQQTRVALLSPTPFEKTESPLPDL